MSRRFSGASSENYSNGTGWSVNISQPWSVCGWLYLVSGANPIDSDVCYTQDGNGSETRLSVFWDITDAPAVWWHTPSSDYTEFITAGVWIHLGMTYDGANTVKAYRNGSVVSTITATIASNVQNFLDIGAFDGSTVLEVAQVKYWVGYQLTSAEMLAEKGYKAPVAGRSFVRGHWQLETSTLGADSSGNGIDLVGTSSAGLQFEPDQPVGITTLRSPSTIVAGANTLKQLASTLTSASTFVAGGASNGTRNGAATLTSGSQVLPAGTQVLGVSVVLSSASAITPAANTQKQLAAVLSSGTSLLPITVTAVKNGAVTLTTATQIQGLGLVPKFGAVVLTSATHLQLAAAQKLNAAAQLSTSTVLSGVVNMLVSGSARLDSASQISAYAAISSVAPVWFSDEPRIEYTVHTPWTSNLSDS